MAPPTIPTGVPATLIAGDSAVWDDPALSHVLYGAFRSTDGWVLTYRFTGPGGQLVVTAATEGSGWRTTLTAEQTRTLKASGASDGADAIQVLGQVSQGSDAITLIATTLTLQLDPVTQAAGTESYAARMLRVVRVAIEDLVTRGLKSASVQGRSYTKNELGELRALESHYAEQVRSEQAGGRWQTMEVAFVPVR